MAVHRILIVEAEDDIGGALALCAACKTDWPCDAYVAYLEKRSEARYGSNKSTA